MYFVTQLLDPKMQLSRAAFLFENVVQEELSTSYLFVKDIHTIYLSDLGSYSIFFSESHSAFFIGRKRTNIYNFHFLS